MSSSRSPARSGRVPLIISSQVASRNCPAPVALDSAFLASDDADQHLLTIVKDQTTGCFDRVNYKDSEYCVPEGAKYTKQILQLLAQLLALQTQAGDLAITPTVRVTP